MLDHYRSCSLHEVKYLDWSSLLVKTFFFLEEEEEGMCGESVCECVLVSMHSLLYDKPLTISK